MSKKVLRRYPTKNSKRVQSDPEAHTERVRLDRTSSKWKALKKKIHPWIRSIKRFLQDVRDTPKPLLYFLIYIFKMIDNYFHLRPALRAFESFLSTIPKFTNWREENIKQAVADAAPLDSDALSWLYQTSSSTSVHRIIARCLFMHRNIAHTFESDSLNNFWRILEVGETYTVDIRHGLYADLLSRECNYWFQLPSMANAVLERQLDEVEYKNYSRIAENVKSANYVEILKDAIKDDFKLPLVMWHCFLARASVDDDVARHIITCGIRNMFDGWLIREITEDTEDTENTEDTAYFQTVLETSGEPTE